MDRSAANAHISLWIAEERSQYANKKWEEENVELQGEAVANGEWLNFPFSYLQRARAGLDTLHGRMALGKVITSCTSLLERAVMMYGEMPQPGVSSTEGAREWQHDPEPDVAAEPPYKGDGHDEIEANLVQIRELMEEMTYPPDVGGQRSNVAQVMDHHLAAIHKIVTMHRQSAATHNRAYTEA